MAHENLQLSINLTKVKEALKADPQKGYRTERGDLYVTIFCDSRKTDSAKGETHSLHIGKIGNEKIYVGNAKLSKFQPERQQQAKASDQVDEEFPF